jgi:uncharacterized coiled-coil protein SlyX
VTVTADSLGSGIKSR